MDRGFSLVELVVAAGLVSALTLLALTTVGAQRRGAAVIAARAEVVETSRIAQVVLAEELRAGTSGRDHAAAEGDSLLLRAFRGLGLVCPGPATDSASLRVRYAGLRLPEPAKDSLLVLSADLRWSAVALLSRATETAPCGGDPEPVERWVLSASPAQVLLARVFESGVYLLQARAFRYRRGFGGRQPLTPELLLEERSTLGGAPAGPVRLRLDVRSPIPNGSGSESEVAIWPRERASP